jgi:hypothetical protein
VFAGLSFWPNAPQVGTAAQLFRLVSSAQTRRLAGSPRPGRNLGLGRESGLAPPPAWAERSPPNRELISPIHVDPTVSHQNREIKTPSVGCTQNPRCICFSFLQLLRRGRASALAHGCRRKKGGAARSKCCRARLPPPFFSLFHSLSPAEHRGNGGPHGTHGEKERWRRLAPSRRRVCSPEAEHTAVEGPRGGALLPGVRGRGEIWAHGGHRTRRRNSSILHNGGVASGERSQVGPSPFPTETRVRVSLGESLSDLKSVLFSFFLFPKG